jgi:hypothetical protein
MEDTEHLERTRALSEELVKSTGKRGENDPSGKLVAQCCANLMVSLAMIATALGQRNG